MSKQLRLVSLIQNELKNYSSNIEPSYHKDEVAFWCPFCKLEHYKKKLTIRIDSDSDRFGNWQCWNCNISHNTRGTNVITLLKKLGAKNDSISEAKTILNSIGYNFDNDSHHVDRSNRVLNLPTEFIPLSSINKNSPIYRNALKYLLKRGLNPLDIIRYKIGYCEEGKYGNMIIVPSYDQNWNLNYFTARSFINKWKINPPIERNKIIPFESYINWKLPLFLTEGVFDAIAIRRNAIPLLSKTISSLIYKKILENSTPEIIFALDSDAKATSIKYIKYFLDNDIRVKYLDFQKLNIKDAGSTKFSNIIDIYYNTSYINYNDLIKFKLEKI